jgi:two-component system sensor histidine kinase MtrB
VLIDVGRVLRWPEAMWRRSLQFRVVAATFLLAGTVMTLLGTLLMRQVRDAFVSANPTPEAHERQMAATQLVQRSLILSGLLLAVLLAGIVWLVTRQVIAPIRTAARTAERLSAGLLEERMAVRGEDDIAKLADSFNQMAASLQLQIVQLEDLSRLQRRFTSDVSHELRTPLTTIRMATDMLHGERGSFSPGAARSAELLTAELDRFEALLAELLEISRYDAGAAVLHSEPADLAALIAHVVDGFAPLAERCHVQLVVEAPPEGVVAMVDRGRVERILRNLVGNAIEYGAGEAGAPQPVTITLASDAERLAIAVRDEGEGFRSDDVEAVFSRFWRADPSRARHTGGTGLGLAIAREDARLHGGELAAWSEPGRGALFRVVLPLHPGGELGIEPAPLPLGPRE